MLAHRGDLPTVELPSAAVRERRALASFRQLLVGQRVQLQNRLRAVLVAQGIGAPCGHRAWTEAGLAFWSELARPLAQCSTTELWRGQLHVALELYRSLIERIADVEAKLDAIAASDPLTQIVRSAPGVGPRTAEVVAAYIDRPKRFKNARQISAYAGLVPRQYQSGLTDRMGHITRRGPRLLRKMLVEAAWVMLRYNDWAKRTFARLTKGQRTRKKQALVALARKLLVRLWAMMRDGVPWKEPVPIS
jgi:transposase